MMRKFLLPAVLVSAALAVESGDWLSVIPDGTQIVDLPILPGSHNSGSARTRMAVGAHQFARQQSLSIANQLEAGVRLVDLRVRFDTLPVTNFFNLGPAQRGIIRVAHGLDVGYTLAAALGEVEAFLAAHPTEFVVVMLRGDWPPNKSFAKDEGGEKISRVAHLVEDLKNSGLEWVPVESVGMVSTVEQWRGKAVLLTEWFNRPPTEAGEVPADLLLANGMPYRDRDIWYSVCDLWNTGLFDDATGKIDAFMSTKSESDAGVGACRAYPGSRLFTGVALDKSGTSSFLWNRWFLKNLETNPAWRPQMTPPAPVGVVLLDFVEPAMLRRLLDVGFRMAGLDHHISQ